MARSSGSFRWRCRPSSSPPGSLPKNPAPRPTASGGRSTPRGFRQVRRCLRRLAAVPLYIDDTPALSVAALRTRARRLKRQHGLGLIVVDYLQLLRPSNQSRAQENRVQEISDITRGLKALAKELDVPVLALSQLSRAVG